jgi:hypothetical protein
MISLAWLETAKTRVVVESADSAAKLAKVADALAFEAIFKIKDFFRSLRTERAESTGEYPATLPQPYADKRADQWPGVTLGDRRLDKATHAQLRRWPARDGLCGSFRGIYRARIIQSRRSFYTLKTA